MSCSKYVLYLQHNFLWAVLMEHAKDASYPHTYASEGGLCKKMQSQLRKEK